jgi:PhoD-like phosphatase, N-terminal domain/PhoD-like phosphatase
MTGWFVSVVVAVLVLVVLQHNNHHNNNVVVVVQANNGIPNVDQFKATTYDDYQRFRKVTSSKSSSTSNNSSTSSSSSSNTTTSSASSSNNNTTNRGGGFFHGVASGDPLPTAIIVWTRFTPPSTTTNTTTTTNNDTYTLELRMTSLLPLVSSLPLQQQQQQLLDPNFNIELRRTKIQIHAHDDYIAKVDVTGLQSGTSYLYAFYESSTNTTSSIGQTKTSPSLLDTNTTQLTYAVFSCANYGNGYFHAYDIASTIVDLDVWIHVGDYIVRLFVLRYFLYYYSCSCCICCIVLFRQCQYIPK